MPTEKVTKLNKGWSRCSSRKWKSMAIDHFIIGLCFTGDLLTRTNMMLSPLCSKCVPTNRHLGDAACLNNLWNSFEHQKHPGTLGVKSILDLQEHVLQFPKVPWLNFVNTTLLVKQTLLIKKHTQHIREVWLHPKRRITNSLQSWDIQKVG